MTFSQISAPKVWHAHLCIQFHTMVAKISQRSRKDPHIIWNQMLLIKKICNEVNSLLIEYMEFKSL